MIMKRLLTYVVLAAALVAWAPATCQPTIPLTEDGDYHLDEDYGVNFLNGSLRLSDFYTTADVQTKLKDLWGWAKYKGWSDAEIMSMRFFEAAWHDAFWRGQNGLYNAATPMPATDITGPAGKFLVTTNLPAATGIYSGKGSRFSDDSQWQHTFGSTELVMDHVGWKTNRFPEKFLIRSTSWGSTDAQGAWVHNLVIQHFNFNGARRQKNLVQGQPLTALVAIQDIGEACEIRDCYFEGSEGDGLLLVGATPGHYYNNSFFKCNGYGAVCEGSGTHVFFGPSGDENGLATIAGIPSRRSYFPTNGGSITVVGFKGETGTSPNDQSFRPFDGQAMYYFEGWWVVDIDGGKYSATAIYPYAFIHVKGPVNTPSITWNGVQFFGNSPRCILYDEATDTEYLFDGNAYATYMDNGRWTPKYGLKCDWPITIATAKRTTKGLLQHVGVDGATSWATAGIYNPYGAATPVPPPTCTWVLGPETCPTCTTGQAQVTCRTPYVSSSSGCTPATAKPQDQTRVQQCATPPPSGGPIETVSNWSNASATYSVSKPAWVATRTWTFTDLRPNALNYQMIANNGSKGIVVLPTGAMVLNTSGGDEVLLPAGTLKVGTAWSGTVTLPRAVDLTRFGALPGAGNAFLGTFKTMVVSK